MGLFTQLDLYKVLFMIELLVAEFLFTFRLRRKPRYVVRLIGGWAVCMLVAFFCPIVQYNAFYTSVMFILLFGCTIIDLKICYDEPWLNILFCALAAYTMQHFSYGCFDLLLNATGLKDMSASMGGDTSTVPWEIYGSGAVQLSNGFTYIAYFGCYALGYWLIFVLFCRQIKKGQALTLNGFGFLFLSLFVLISNVVFNSVIVYHSYETFDKVYYCITALYNVLCCIIALDLQFMMVKKNQLETELDTVSYLLHEKEKQYAMSKESIDLINQKCHDMKHQIGLWGRAQGIEREAVREMEETISVYDSLVKTGNEALDIILSEKTLACHGKGIRLTCVADGGKLNFIRDTDLYSLFGNLIDNAVEATVKLPSEEKRVISLVIKSVKGMVTVNVRNYFTGGIRFENGIPKSTKGDDRYHGFGMKSIQRIVEKYGGNLSVQTEEDVFFVNILFPAVAAEKSEKTEKAEKAEKTENGGKGE